MISVTFSQFSIRQRLQVMWYVLIGRTIDFAPVKDLNHIEVKMIKETK